MAAGEMRAPEDAPFGTGAELRRLAGTVRERPPRVRPVPTRGPAVAERPEQDLNDGYDEKLFAPTERPDEPITAGAPFGPGPTFVPLPQETTRSFAIRVAQMLEESPQADALRPYIERLRAGG